MLTVIFGQVVNHDALSMIMIALALYVGFCVIIFSLRYMAGDKLYKSFFINIFFLLLALSTMFISDDIRLVLISCAISHITLVRLMMHKSSWKPAVASAKLAAKTYGLSLICLLFAFVCFYHATHQTKVTLIVQHPATSGMLAGLILLAISAMAQSALWPFHRWLLSSLNSPTPVSAIMHAGLIGSGAFFILRFAPLYLKYPLLLNGIFVVGMLSALLGTLWKLMQSDVKRMLACSTMGQMGFVFVQCGLGLFPFAASHLVWHGLFKAYLFLASSGAAQEKRPGLDYPPSIVSFICAIACGCISWLVFALITSKPMVPDNSIVVIMSVVIISGAQFALTIISRRSMLSFLFAVFITSVSAMIYGLLVNLIAQSLLPIMKPQPLNAFHGLGIFILTMSWLLVLFVRNDVKSHYLSLLMRIIYVYCLNASQPCLKTITTHRNKYHYQ